MDGRAQHSSTDSNILWKTKMEDSNERFKDDVRQSAAALLATQVANTEAVSSVYASIMSVNGCMKDLEKATSSLNVIRTTVEALKVEMDEVAEKDDKLMTLLHTLEKEVGEITKNMLQLDKVLPTLQALEEKVDALTAKASDVDKMLDRVEAVEIALKGNDPRSPPITTRGGKGLRGSSSGRRGRPPGKRQ